MFLSFRKNYSEEHYYFSEWTIARMIIICKIPLIPHSHEKGFQFFYFPFRVDFLNKKCKASET